MAYIYRIINLSNGKVYIGSTINPKRREYDHFRCLCRQKHHSIHLQRAYDLSGADSFAFEVLESCDISLRKQREVYFISKFKSHDKQFGYNTYSPNEHKFSCAAETKKKILDSHIKNKRVTPVDVYDMNLNYICSYSSVKRCSIELKVSQGSIHSIIRGKPRLSCNGMTFAMKGQKPRYPYSPKQRFK